MENSQETKTLTIGERLEGNILFSKFCGFDVPHTDRWYLDAAQFDKSWQDLMTVARKIHDECYVEHHYTNEAGNINKLRFNFIHNMMHEVLGPGGFEFLYRESVMVVKAWLEYKNNGSGNESDQT